MIIFCSCFVPKPESSSPINCLHLPKRNDGTLSGLFISESFSCRFGNVVVDVQNLLLMCWRYIRVLFGNNLISCWKLFLGVDLKEILFKDKRRGRAKEAKLEMIFSSFPSPSRVIRVMQFFSSELMLLEYV